ncbi:MAG: IspD/TarI family cytidylyltransferase [Oscillospiraceae bacterium]
MSKKPKNGSRPFCSCVVAAAGSSERMGEDKLFLPLGSSFVLAKTLQALQESPDIDELIVVTRSEKIPRIADLAKEFDLTKLRHIVAGAENRTASVLCGVRLCSAEAKLIAIHDGARPLVSAEVIGRAVLAARDCGAAAPAIHARDTVRQARGGRVLKTLERDELYLMQTPQVFEAQLIRTALEDAVRLSLSLTDDCQAVMLMDRDVYLVEGADDNLKLTTQADIFAARAILEARGEWTCG